MLSDTEEQKGEDPAFELLSRAGDRVELTLYLLKLNLKRPEFGETLLRMRLILRDLCFCGTGSERKNCFVSPLWRRPDRFAGDFPKANCWKPLTFLRICRKKQKRI